MAKENALWLSKLLLYWVNPLIKKGRFGKIQSPDDVFDLPPDMSAAAASETFARADVPSTSLLAKLWSIYWSPFLTIGLLRLMADLAGFASPILLNAVINFMENRSEDVRWGYLYAFGLCLSTVGVALFNTHFNLQMTELTIKAGFIFYSAFI